MAVAISRTSSENASRRVVAVGGPFALAVAAQVDAVGVPAAVGEHLGGGAPGEAGLATAVEQDDRGAGGIAELVGAQPQSVPAVEIDRGHGGQRTGGAFGSAFRRTSRKGTSRSAADSRGMPSTRSLMMLRWISLLPPARHSAWREEVLRPFVVRLVVGPGAR